MEIDRIGAEGIVAVRTTEVTVTLEDGLPVAGTLAAPEEERPYPTVVILFTGQVDRDANSRAGRLAIGEALAARGVASYRFDRRGAGATPGKWSYGGFYQQRRDDVQVVRAIAARPDVGAVGLVGVSAGALNAAWIAGQVDVAALVLVACPATTGAEALVWSVGQMREDAIPLPIRLVLRLLRRTPAEQARRIGAAITAGGTRLFGLVPIPLVLREMVRHDMRPDLAAVEAPVLAITGTRDVQVNPDDLDAIAGLVQGPVETRRFPDLTHMLRRDPDPGAPRHWRDLLKQPVDPGLIDDIADWMAATLPAAPR